MKFTMGRTMKILVAILIVAIIAIVMLSPYSFEKYTASSKMIQVTSTDTVTKDANGKKEIRNRHGVNKAQMGHFSKAGVSGKGYVREFKFE